jgi:hypothetical protein
MRLLRGTTSTAALESKEDSSGTRPIIIGWRRHGPESTHIGDVAVIAPVEQHLSIQFGVILTLSKGL